MPFIKRGIYQRLRFCSETTPQQYILADVTAVCFSLISATVLLAYKEILLLICLDFELIALHHVIVITYY